MLTLLRSYLSPSLWVALLAFGLGPALAEDAPSPKMPKLLPNHGIDWYPDKWRLRHIEGRALVEFQISPQGRAVKVEMVASEPRKAFDSVVKAIMRDARYEVPTDWESSGASVHRFRVSWVFIIRPCLDSAPCDEPAQFPADGSLTITGTPIRPPQKP